MIGSSDSDAVESALSEGNISVAAFDDRQFHTLALKSAEILQNLRLVELVGQFPFAPLLRKVMAFPAAPRVYSSRPNPVFPAPSSTIEITPSSLYDLSFRHSRTGGAGQIHAESAMRPVWLGDFPGNPGPANEGRGGRYLAALRHPERLGTVHLVHLETPERPDRVVAAIRLTAGAAGMEASLTRLKEHVSALFPVGACSVEAIALDPFEPAPDETRLIALARKHATLHARADVPAVDARIVREQIAAAWAEVLGCAVPTGNTTFFDLGGTSLQLLPAQLQLSRRLGLRVDVTTLLETPRLHDLAQRLAGQMQGPPTNGPRPAPKATAAEQAPPPDQVSDTAIAIIGMAGRFPGVGSIGAFWEAICEGRNLIERFPADALEDAFTDSERAAPDYVPVRPVLDGVDQFDARFFGFLPREAAVMDPQHRIFLEICYEALETAGYDPLATPGRVGVFAGQSANTYALHNIFSDRARLEDFTSNFQVGNYAELTGSWVDSLATRVAFKLDLKGPALTVQTACSTSLTAIAQACESLLAGSSDMALAGGISITFPQRRGYRALEGGMVSPDGTCRPFDAGANGTVFGHGAGVVVLKPLRAALRDGDAIVAVIRGVGINNDGADKIAYTAPSMNGQAGAIRAAHHAAGVEPETVSYIECHGTATPLGDPVELSGLAQVFKDRCAAGSVAIGSVKGNIGHLDAAAGVVSVIKTALMMQHGEIPPVANFRAATPKFDFAVSPFRVPVQRLAWLATEGPRRAGVSSFGVGGTNVHLVMEEAPAQPEVLAAPGPHILPLSARSPEALAVMRAQLADFIEQNTLDLGNLAFTLQESRHPFTFRHAIACTDSADAVAQLRKPLASPRATPEDAPPVVFMFPGQGSQYPGMGSGLYADEPVFREWIDRGAELLEPLLGLDINRLLCLGDASDSAATRALRETRLTQPALYLTQVATAQLWMARGIRPAAMIGHSVGEFAAATLAGVMDFEAGLKIIATRGRLMQDQPAGAMLSVRAAVEDIEGMLDGSVEIAARNAPRLCVLAGTFDAIATMERKLEKAGIPNSRLHTSHAFHSRMMDPVIEPLREAVSAVALRKPDIPLVSCVSGTWLTDTEARDPGYWAAQARATVSFMAGLLTVIEGQEPVLVEVGAGRALSAFAGQSLPREGHGGIFKSLPDHTRSVEDGVAMADSAGGLWAAGADLDWQPWRRGQARRIPAPTYPFERRRHWVDAPAPLRRQASAGAPSPLSCPAAPPHTETPSPTSIPAMAQSLIAEPLPLEEHRLPRLVSELSALLSELSGDEIGAADADATFLELGFDSLFLGQVSQRLSKDYGVQITFRQLLSDYPTTAALAAHVGATLPPESPKPPQPRPATLASVPAPVAAAAPDKVPETRVAAPGLEGLVQQQISAMQSLFSEQLRAMRGAGHGDAAPAPLLVPATAQIPAPPPATLQTPIPSLPAPQTLDAPVRYTIGRGVSASASALSDAQLRFATDLAARYGARHLGSKERTARYRNALADPRTAAGFRAEWKEMVFPIVAERSKGARIWDVDGNEFIDIVSGFGQTAFGHAPDFVLEALQRQMDKGFAIGPQSDLAGSVAEHFARFSGHERVTFCNTGSEAVMAAMRVARAVTGRDRIVVFANDYHGQFDEVLIKGRSRGGPPAALPIAPGIPRSGLTNMTVLSYGGSEALDWIRAHLNEIAAIIVEPVQSRHPEHRPVEFVRELRTLADQGGAALVFDEVVTGFRVHKRGMQGVWGIRADLATYGKIVGGGMPIGVLAGDARFMNALDGGPWSYGDLSKPEAPPTFFAGTFVRHPLVLAAVDATLKHMDAQGDALWSGVAARTDALVAGFDALFDRRGLPRMISGYSSWYAFNLMQHAPSAALAYPMLRLAGVHVQEGYCGFMTTAHTEQDFQRIGAVMEEVIDQLQDLGILQGERPEPAAAPPAASARSGVDQMEPAASLPRQIPLTAEQREIWMTAQLGDLASTSFNEGMSVHLRGTLDADILAQSLTALVARHDALRLVFSRDGESFEVADPYEVALPLHDLRATPDPAAALRALVDEEARTPFDLVDGPPFRASLARIAEAEQVLILNAHHIVCDGWSYNVLLGDLAAVYAALSAGKTPDLPPAPSFAEHALKHAGKPHAAEVDAYWRGQYTTLPALPELPVDRPRTARRSFNGATFSAHLDAERTKQIRAAGARHGCTLFTTLFAGLHMVLGRLSGSNDLVIGVPTGGQALLENPALIGHCVNFLPIRAAFDPKAPAAAHLAHVRDQVFAAFEHQQTTYGALVQSLNIERSINRLPLTEVQFNLEKLAAGIAIDGLDITVTPNPKTGVNFDLFFNVIESRQGLRFDVDYNSDLFDAGTIARWIGHLEALLLAVAKDADTPVSRLAMMTPGEALKLERQHNATEAGFPRKTLPHLLRCAAATHAQAIALEAPDGTLTHGELDTLTDALAARIQRALPDPGARVAVALERSQAMVIAIIAVLKAGHTYVPLDPQQPDARLRLILEAAETSAIISDGGDLPGYAQGLGLVAIAPRAEGAHATPIRHPVDPESAAYVIFTSGSTGTPKGVEVPHRAVVNFLTSMAREPGFGPGDSILAVTTISFDIAVLEIFLPLMTGGRTVLARSTDVLDAFRLVDRLAQGNITVLQSTPTLWQMLLEAGFKPHPGLKMLAGGEPLPADLAARLTATGGTLWNMYGPTETTVWSAVHRIEPGAARITIGHPIANTLLHILSPDDQLLPVGVTGELNIGGHGLARGYFQRPELTAAAFREVDLPGGRQRLYRTGDMARRLPDGTIEVLGRIDNQIKLRGFRIELGDVEGALRQLPSVGKAAVALRPGHDGSMQLVGYVVPEPGGAPSSADLMRQLQARLPGYMVPTAWVMLDALPQTMNGKLDRNALPLPGADKVVVPLRTPTAPATGLERQLAGIWQEVLGLEAISTTDTLFALGADSLKVFRIAARMLDADLNLEARDLLEHPSIKELAAYAATRDTTARSGPVRPSLRDFRNGARRAAPQTGNAAQQQ
ncbi:non-ribosomal peptide synthetase/type I polyketide synthase [Pararhodobacter sp.]|uniref:non-ribosomal peptide synthetase/type I polyketide synthase n=1 Tax=Pararhodobacter sp. TaxID=2127056 RepID=UPI002FDDBDAD